MDTLPGSFPAGEGEPIVTEIITIEDMEEMRRKMLPSHALTHTVSLHKRPKRPVSSPKRTISKPVAKSSHKPALKAPVLSSLPPPLSPPFPTVTGEMYRKKQKARKLNKIAKKNPEENKYSAATVAPPAVVTSPVTVAPPAPAAVPLPATVIPLSEAEIIPTAKYPLFPLAQINKPCPTLSLQELLKCLKDPQGLLVKARGALPRQMRTMKNPRLKLLAIAPQQHSGRPTQTSSDIAPNVVQQSILTNRYIQPAPPAGASDYAVQQKMGKNVSFFLSNGEGATPSFTVPKKLPIPANPNQLVFSYIVSDYSSESPLPEEKANKLSSQTSLLPDSGNSGNSGNTGNLSNSGSTDIGKRKPCRCASSHCLKLYCDCFNVGLECDDACFCKDCQNNPSSQEERAKAVAAVLKRNPLAFQPKVVPVLPVTLGEGEGEGEGEGDEERGRPPTDRRSHVKGCNCRKSGCLKRYCECFLAQTLCGVLCRCVGCQNPGGHKDKGAEREKAEGCGKSVVASHTTPSDSPVKVWHSGSQVLAERQVHETITFTGNGVVTTVYLPAGFSVKPILVSESEGLPADPGMPPPSQTPQIPEET